MKTPYFENRKPETCRVDFSLQVSGRGFLMLTCLAEPIVFFGFLPAKWAKAWRWLVTWRCWRWAGPFLGDLLTEEYSRCWMYYAILLWYIAYKTNDYGFRGLMVMTSASHAEGSRFDPGRSHSIIFSIHVSTLLWPDHSTFYSTYLIKLQDINIDATKMSIGTNQCQTL